MDKVTLPIDLEELKHRYADGETVQQLARNLGISRPTIQRRLLRLGVTLRTQAEANARRMARLSPEERQRLTAASHNAVRGVAHTEEHRHRIAQTRERIGAADSQNEARILAALYGSGFEVTPQKACGRYSIDIGVESPRLAIDIFGGHWHRNGRHAARHHKRIAYLIENGWHPLIVWCTAVRPLDGHGIAKILTIAQSLQSTGGPPIEAIEIHGDGTPSQLSSTIANV